MSEVYAELFTPSQLTDPAEGGALLEALGRHLPSWMPHRYGWGEPLRHVYDPSKAEHFWSQRMGVSALFRNASKYAAGEVERRHGPWDILSRVEISGKVPRAEQDSVGAFLADCGRSIDISYAMAHIFSPQQADEYYTAGAWYTLAPEAGDRVKAARQGTFPYYLRDLYWANVFGPPYTELFGAGRLRTAPAAVVTELREEYFYLQVTDAIADLYTPDAIPRYRAARDAVKEHLGSDCFYEAGAATPRRAPVWRTAAEEGLWKPREDARLTDELRALLAKAPDQ